VLIPSIDLMGGKIVQLVQGKRKALEFDDFDEWVERFSRYPLVQVIDLDAAIGSGDNGDAVKDLCRRLPCQVGGGIRSAEVAAALLAAGARKVIVGSSLIQQAKIDAAFAENLARQCSLEKLVFAVDSFQGRVAIKGWKEATNITAKEMMRILEPYCSAFLYTHIDTEGLLQGIPLDVIREVKSATSKRLIAAGGIRSLDEVHALDEMGVDAVVGMAIYRGLIPA